MNRLGEPPIHLIANNVWLYVLNVFTISNCKSCGRANLGKLLLGKSPHRGCGGCGWNFHDGLILMSAPTEWTCGQGQGIPYFARWSRLRGWLHGRLPWKRNCRRQSMDWFVWENFNRKAHDLHGKIESFRLRFSQQNQSIESTMHPSWDPSHPWAQNLLALLRWETSAGSFASDFCTTSAAPPWLHSSGDFRDVLCDSPT